MGSKSQNFEYSNSIGSHLPNVVSLSSPCELFHASYWFPLMCKRD